MLFLTNYSRCLYFQEYAGSGKSTQKRNQYFAKTDIQSHVIRVVYSVPDWQTSRAVELAAVNRKFQPTQK